MATEALRGLLAPASQGWIVGIDEVGRGCLAGPVAACAYGFRRGSGASDGPIVGLRDSKKLSARQREALVPRLKLAGIWGHGSVKAGSIDSQGIGPATFAAMREALEGFQHASGALWSEMAVVIDGSALPRWRDLPLHSLTCLVKADDLLPQVSAASVLAKVQRDRQMALMDVVYPGYGFARHAGYGTAAHVAAIDTLGPCPLHRMSFAPMNRSAPRL